MTNQEHNAKGKTMDARHNYSWACEVLGFTTPKSLKQNAMLAESKRTTLCKSTPLRVHVAIQILIDAAK